jgi:signal transduction histidine kinase
MAVVFLGAQIVFQNLNFVESHRRVTHTLAVQVLTDDLLINAIDGSSGVRAYVIAGNESFLKPYERMRDTLMAQYDNLVRLTSDNPVQQKNLTPLKEALKQRLDESARLMRLYREEGPVAAIKRVSGGFGREINERIESEVNRIVDEENKILVERESQVSQESNKLFMFDGLAIASMLLMVGWIAHSMANEWRFRDAAMHERNLLNAELASKNEALEVANAALVQSDQYKNEFLSSMSHELRTPLNSIIGFSNIMRSGMSGPLNEDQKKQIGMVEDSAMHLLELINGLLDLSSIESGKARLDIERFDLCEVTHKAFMVLAPLAEKKALTLKNHCDEYQHIYVWADRRKIYQVILNLINNAIKFSDKGVISLEYRQHDKKCEVSVSDQGMGIPPDQIPKLFQAFHQVDGSYRKLHEGTGLGLYLCKKLLELMGGRIGVKSELGVGSTFTIEIPAQQETVSS